VKRVTAFLYPFSNKTLFYTLTKKKVRVFLTLFSKSTPNKVKASGGCHRFSKETFRASSKKSGQQIRQGGFDYKNWRRENESFTYDDRVKH
jgi:hypothetical protein